MFFRNTIPDSMRVILFVAVSAATLTVFARSESVTPVGESIDARLRTIEDTLAVQQLLSIYMTDMDASD
jgi:hypothetical protein